MEQLTFNFSASEYNGWPHIRILVDQNIIHDSVVDKDNINVAIDINHSPGIHSLEIQRYGKTDHNVLFVNGEILKDQSVTLNSISYNNVKLADYFLYRGRFYSNNHEYPGVLNWGANGVWRWEFGIPFVQWAVDSSEPAVHPDLIIPHKTNAVELKNKINSLRKVWQ